jgi:hypothetical protein
VREPEQEADAAVEAVSEESAAEVSAVSAAEVSEVSVAEVSGVADWVLRAAAPERAADLPVEV